MLDVDNARLCSFEIKVTLVVHKERKLDAPKHVISCVAVYDGRNGESGEKMSSSSSRLLLKGKAFLFQ